MTFLDDFQDSLINSIRLMGSFRTTTEQILGYGWCKIKAINLTSLGLYRSLRSVIRSSFIL